MGLTPTPQRFGVFGGAFDPPHLGHIALVKGALEHFDFDRLLIVPAGDPPHNSQGPICVYGITPRHPYRSQPDCWDLHNGLTEL